MLNTCGIFDLSVLTSAEGWIIDETRHEDKVAARINEMKLVVTEIPSVSQFGVGQYIQKAVMMEFADYDLYKKKEVLNR